MKGSVFIFDRTIPLYIAEGSRRNDLDIDEEECLEMESVMHAVELNMHLLSSLLSSHACSGPYEWCIFC